MSTRNVDIVILGGGFNAIYSAYSLSKKGLSVALFVDGDTLGGVMRSLVWNNIVADLGIHNLDLRTERSNIFYNEILKNDLITWQRSDFASFNGTSLTMGIECPNLDGIRNFNLNALNSSVIAGSQSMIQTDNLENFLLKRFGKPIQKFILEQIARFTDANPKVLAASCLASIGFLSRVFFGSDLQMEKLKSSSAYFNEAYAVTQFSEKKEFLGLNGCGNLFGYPKGGLLTFCKKIEDYFVKNKVQTFYSKIKSCKLEGDVKIIKNCNGEAISAKRVFSTIPIRRISEFFLNKKLEDYENIGGIRLVLFYVKGKKLEEKISLEYINDFSDNAKFFRVGAVGIKAEKADEGIVCVEVPFVPKNSQENTRINVNSIWKRVKDINFVKDNLEYYDAQIIEYKRAYSFLTLNEERKDKQLTKILEKKDIFSVPSELRGRESFITYFENSEFCQEFR
jgi:protoporphyrinogen oxidase